MQGAEGTGDSGCEVHYGSVGEESISQEFNCPVVPVSSDDAPGRRRHCCCIRALCSVQEVVDVETFQAVRQVTLALDVLLELQNEAKFELAFPRRERRRGRPPDPARLGSSVCFAPQKIRHLSRPQSLCRTTPSKKKSCDAVRALPPLNCICVGPPH